MKYEREGGIEREELQLIGLSTNWWTRPAKSKWFKIWTRGLTPLKKCIIKRCISNTLETVKEPTVNSVIICCSISGASCCAKMLN